MLRYDNTIKCNLPTHWYINTYLSLQQVSPWRKISVWRIVITVLHLFQLHHSQKPAIRLDFVLTNRFNYSPCVLRQRTLALIWLHLLFLPDTFFSSALSPVTQSCGKTQWNCIHFNFVCGVTWNRVRQNIIISLTTLNPFREGLRRRQSRLEYYCDIILLITVLAHEQKQFTPPRFWM